MELKPRLIDVAMPEHAVGTVLLLHGGARRRDRMMVSPTQLSVLRMIPIATRVARAGQGRLQVVRLLNTYRGWDASHTPLDDVRWALEELSGRAGGALPTCLIGHSLGGRAAILSVTQPGVVGAAALAPWVYPDDVPPGLSGQEILIVHGTRDRIASPQRSAALAQRLKQRTRVRYLSVEGGKHAMLSKHSEFSRPAAEFAVELLTQSPAAERTIPA